jgi:hypothetical protein
VRNRLALIGAALVISAAVACSDDGGFEQEPQPDSPLTTIASSSGTQPPVVVATALLSAVGPGISVAEALDSRLGGPLLVNGFLFTEGGDVWLCTALAREAPPTCGAPRLRVTGLDPAAVEGVEFLDGVGWSSESLGLLGAVAGGVLTVSGTMLAQ